MYENDIRVGFIKLADDTLEVFVNTTTGEVYYVDGADFAYLLLGIDHSCSDVVNDEARAAATNDFEGDGIVYDGQHKWIIYGTTAYKVPLESEGTAGAIDTVMLDVDTEYECED